MRAFLNHGIPAGEIMISTRSAEKLNPLLKCYPDISVVSSEEVILSDILFLCVRSEDALQVLKTLNGFKGHLVSINGGVSLNDLSSVYSGPITKAMPSITVEIGRGITLVCHNSICDTSEVIEQLFSLICNVMVFPEDQFPDAENITGCSPAFFAKFAQLLSELSNIPLEKSLHMAKETLIATALLLDDEDMSLDQIISDVATEGGITEKGLSVMAEELPRVIKKMYDGMH